MTHLNILKYSFFKKIINKNMCGTILVLNCQESKKKLSLYWILIMLSEIKNPNFEQRQNLSLGLQILVSVDKLIKAEECIEKFTQYFFVMFEGEISLATITSTGIFEWVFVSKDTLNCLKLLGLCSASSFSQKNLAKLF